MDVIKKSFQISSDLAQRLDDVLSNKPGLSFTFLVNEALGQWFIAPKFEALLDTQGDRASAPVRRSANISSTHVAKIESMKESKPGVNTTLIVNQALWEWVKNPVVSPVTEYTDEDVQDFMDANSELMDKLAE